MKTIKIIAAALVLLAVFANAQTIKTGTTAGQVLKLNVGPRAIGMGGAFSASADDITAIHWNPAGAALVYGSEAIFTHSTMYADIRHDFAGFITNFSGLGTVGAFVSALTVGEMPVRTIELPEGTGEYFDAGALVLGLTYAKNLTDKFSVGFNAKYINEYIYHMNANGFAVDIGTLYRLPVMNELRIGANISNFGTKMRLEGRDVFVVTPSGAAGGNLLNSSLELDNFNLPLSFRFGIASDVVREETQRVTVEVDAVHPNDHTEYVNAGVEYAWNNAVFLRMGYNSLFEKDTEKGLTFGFGANYLVMGMVGIKFDYAYQSFGRLSNIQYFSLGVKF